MLALLNEIILWFSYAVLGTVSGAVALGVVYIIARVIAHAYFEAKYHFIVRMRGQ